MSPYGADGAHRVRLRSCAPVLVVCWLRLGEEVKAGERYGMIKFGSRTDLLIPADMVTHTLVKVGDKVRGGITVLAQTK